MPDKNLNEENFNEEAIFKVADRRKFNADGSLREGVQFEEAKPQAEATPTETTTTSVKTETLPPPQQTDTSPVSSQEATAAFDQPLPEGDDDFDEKDIPGAENPASFANFLLSLASQAAAAMGLAENPMTGKRTADLELSRYWLDVLGMLHEKTNGNLHPQEQKLFDGLLGDLRLQFVQLARMAEAQMRKQEENLMKQAAQKFSGKDILGK